MREIQNEIGHVVDNDAQFKPGSGRREETRRVKGSAKRIGMPAWTMIEKLGV
jgi:hypothetical protein